MKSKGSLFLLWLFGLLFALSPIGLDWLHNEKLVNPPPLISLIIHCELIIIAIVILADTFVRAVGSDETERLRMPLVLGCPLVLLLLGFDAGGVREAVEGAASPVTNAVVVHMVQIHSAIAFGISMILSLTAAMALEG